MAKEMQRLRDRLDELQIPWWDETDPGIARTKFVVGKKRYSVIHGEGTYGSREGLLELRINKHDPTGYMTADDVILAINEGKQ